MHFVAEQDVVASPGDPHSFSAGVLAAETLAPRRDAGMRAGRLSYDPGARSHWHTHDGEQALYVVAGRGFLGLEGPAGRYLEPGSWVHVEPGELHWHGAVPDNGFVHLAVTASGATNWFEPVSDEEYRAALGIGGSAAAWGRA